MASRIRAAECLIQSLATTTNVQLIGVASFFDLAPLNVVLGLDFVENPIIDFDGLDAWHNTAFGLVYTICIRSAAASAPIRGTKEAVPPVGRLCSIIAYLMRPAPCWCG